MIWHRKTRVPRLACSSDCMKTAHSVVLTQYQRVTDRQTDRQLPHQTSAVLYFNVHSKADGSQRRLPHGNKKKNKKKTKNKNRYMLRNKVQSRYCGVSREEARECTLGRLCETGRSERTRT